MANTTWNPADVTGVVLSNGNLTATVPSTAGGVRGIDKQLSGKFYFEYTLNTNGSTWDFGAGIATGGAARSYGSGGGNAASITVDRGNGFLWNGTTSTGIGFGAIPTGGVLCCAVDFTNGLIWFRSGAAGNWNNNAANNPATAVGGVNFLSPGFAWYPFAGFSGVASGQNVIANFGDTAFAGAVPAGFTSGFTAGVTVNVSEVVTQVAIEEWGVGTPVMQLTQIAIEEWAAVSSVNTQMILTQIAIEEWAPVPPTSLGGPMITTIM
jgi:hypothetical protein